MAAKFLIIGIALALLGTEKMIAGDISSQGEQTAKKRSWKKGGLLQKSQNQKQETQENSPLHETGQNNAGKSDQSPLMVLSIDGACIRGVAQFDILNAIEEGLNKELNSRTKKNHTLTLTDIFDFYSGTSAGSMNIGAILIPADAELAETNTPNGKYEPKYTTTNLIGLIPGLLDAAFSSTTWRKIKTFHVGKANLLGSKYTAKDLEAELARIAGKTRMSDILPALITSYDIRYKEPVNFSTFDICESKQKFADTSKNVYLWEAMRASSAAPIFYKPLDRKMDGKNRSLIDAGLYAMNPALLGFVEAKKVYPGYGDNMIIVSISSGTLKNNVRDFKSKGWIAGGALTVLQPVLETALEGQQAQTDMTMNDLLPGNYYRLSFDVSNKHPDFDDSSKENVTLLREAAKETIGSPAFKEMISRLADVIEKRNEKGDRPKFICKAKPLK